MKNQVITFGTSFREDSNQANISKVLTREVNEKFPLNLTGVHAYYLYEEYPSPKLNFIRITGKYLRVREVAMDSDDLKEIFHYDHKFLKTIDNFSLENFAIWLWEMKTPSYKKFRQWSEIPDSQKTLGIMEITYDKVKSKEYNNDQTYINFEVMLQPSEFKSISNKLLNKKENVEYDFFFNVKNNIDDPPKEQIYTNEILEFKIVKRPGL